MTKDRVEAAPRPIGARLALSEDAKKQISGTRGRRDGRRALQAAHDELAATLVPKLTALRERGVILDFATSWLLAEAVIHVPAELVEEALQELISYPELDDVTSDPMELRRRLRAI